MKRIHAKCIAVTLACVIAVSAAACQPQPDSPATQPQIDAAAETANTAVATENEPSIKIPSTENNVAPAVPPKVDDSAQPEPSPIAGNPANISQTETDDGWISYRSEETGISFSYPAEWGEVTDYFDYYLRGLLKDASKDGLSPEEEEAFSNRKSELQIMGPFLSFSNLNKEWGPNIRITSATKIQSLIADKQKELESGEAEQGENKTISRWYSISPYLGFSGGSLLTDPDFKKEYGDLPQWLQDMADLSDNASQEELLYTTLPLFLSFANGLRYEVDVWLAYGERTPLEGSQHVSWGQITTSDGKLSGVIEAGAEGWDTGGREYWDCILTDPEGERLIHLSFIICGAVSSKSEVEWPAGAYDSLTELTEPEDKLKELSKIAAEQQEILIKFAKSITLLD